MSEIVGVITGDTPDITYVPPQEPVNQFQLAPVPREPPVTDKVVEAPLHKIAGEAEAEVGAVDNELTVTATLTHEVELQVPTALTK